MLTCNCSQDQFCQICEPAMHKDKLFCEMFEMLKDIHGIGCGCQDGGERLPICLLIEKIGRIV